MQMKAMAVVLREVKGGEVFVQCLQFLWVHAVGQDVFSRSQDFTKGFSDMEY